MLGLTRENLRHLRGLVRFGPRPAVTVYESIGADSFLEIAPGWLNLGWWEGQGTDDEAPRAPERLVERLAEPLPKNADILDVANGLGAQDPVIARVAQPRRLTAINLTEFQLRAGRERLRAAGAEPVVADAVRLPFHDDSFDGLICVEAEFHFPSRRAFLAEARRVLRPGGVLSLSDVTVERRPVSVRDALSGFIQLRVWGMTTKQLASARRVAELTKEAGFIDIDVDLCGDRTVDPALKLSRERLTRANDVPAGQRRGALVGLSTAEHLRRRGIIDYVLLSARLPSR